MKKNRIRDEKLAIKLKKCLDLKQSKNQNTDKKK
jgi:hypothetical protein